MGGLLYLNVGFLVNSSDGRVLTIRRSRYSYPSRSQLLGSFFLFSLFLFSLITEEEPFEIFKNGRIVPRALFPSLLRCMRGRT